MRNQTAPRPIPKYARQGPPLQSQLNPGARLVLLFPKVTIYTEADYLGPSCIRGVLRVKLNDREESVHIQHVRLAG